MSSCLLYDQNFLCEGLASVPGITEIYVTNRRNLGYWYYLETSPYQYGEIIGNELPATWFKIYMRQQSCNFNQTQTKDISRLYNQTLSVFWNKISYYKRAGLKTSCQMAWLFLVSRQITLFKKKQCTAGLILNNVNFKKLLQRFEHKYHHIINKG